MSRQFSIFTKMITVMLVVAMCTALMPSTVNSEDPCQSLKDKAWAASAVVAGRCTASVIACGAAISAGNFWGIAGCAWAFFHLCQPAQRAAADAWAAYWNCNYNSNQAN